MEYLRVKNLKRYQHYKDRNITSWIKVVCNILDDPDLASLDDIDRWRWVGIIILATKNKNFIPKNADWIASRVSNSNTKSMSVSINKYISLGWLKVYTKSIPNIEKVYPDLKDLKDLKDLNPAPLALTAALEEINSKNFNIYALINKAKKQVGQPKDWQFPEEVLLRVCEAYKRDKANIRHSWPWFIRVLKVESGLWHANQQIKANEKRKQQGMPESLKAIFKEIH